MPPPGTASLSSRLLAWILPTFLLGSVAISVSAYAIARTLLMREMEREVQVMTEVAAAEVRAFDEQRVNDLATIAQSPLFRDHYKNVEFGLGHEAEMYRRDVDRMLLDFSRRAGVYDQLRYVDASGRDVSRVLDGRVETPGGKADPAAVKDLRPGLQRSSGLLQESHGGAPAIETRQGLFDETGRLRGALAFRWSLGRILGQLSRLRVGETGRSFLLRDGAPIARGAGEVDGRVLAAGLAIPGTRWSVRTVVRRAEFLDRLRWLGQLSVLLAATTIGLIVLVVTRQVRALLRPIATLASAVEAYAEGRLDVRVDPRGPGEVAALGNAFNEMAESLRQRTDDLEHRVRELTALHGINEGVVRRLGRREIARLCLESAGKGLGFERGVLYWIDEKGQQAEGECAFGPSSAIDDGLVFRRRVGFEASEELARAVKGRQPVNVGAAQAGEPLLPGDRSAAYCVVPIFGRERMLAVMAVDGAPVSAQRLRSLSIFGGAVGLALENSGLIEDLFASENRYRTAVENSPDAVIGLDQHMRVTLWNRRAEAIFGYQPSEARGHSLEFLFEAPAYARLVREVETRGSVRQVEAAGLTRDGRRLDLSVSWTGQSGGYGGAPEWVVVIQDETVKKRVHAQLIHAEKMSAAGTLLAGVVHELNNPLQQVIGLAELLKHLAAGPQDRDDFRTLESATMRCASMVHGLLAFVRKDKPERHRVSLNAVAEATLALCEYRFVKSDGIELDLELDPAKPEVAAEFHKLEQIVLNLVLNARDVLHGHPGPRAVRVRTRRRGERCVVEVSDTGPGVPPAVLERLFEPFFTTKSGGKGTGLGLSISRELAESFGGTLVHEEPAEGGARFVLSLPPCPDDVKAPAAPLGLPPPVAGKRVLAADDEEGVLRLIRRILADDGLIVDAAVDGADALRKLSANAYDLVVADVEMGRVKGTDIARVARASAVPPAVVLVTGDILNDELKEELFRLGAAVLAKPFLRTEFLRVVRGALQAAARRRPA
ncbi:MAG: PAS domain S-box protein [Elusimicrobia bacterium]|nr:PAS domain S-box protein [Elusimicrobiota bacterium]